MIIPSRLLAPYEPDSNWNDGPFKHLVSLPARTKGVRIEEIVSLILKTSSHRVSSEHDIIYNGLKTEIKGSFVNRGTTNCFSFLQIRPDQDYEQLLLATFTWSGLVSIYMIPKDQVVAMIDNGLLRKQHGGNKAESRTFCYNGNMKPFESYLVMEEKCEETHKAE